MTVCSHSAGIEQVDLCGLPVEDGVLAHLLESMDIADDFRRTDVGLLASDPVFFACAASVATAVSFRGDGPFPSTLESVVDRLGRQGLLALVANIAFRQQYSAASVEDINSLRELRARGARRGRIALALAERSGYERPEEAHFAALLLDLGRIASLAMADAPNIPDLESDGDAEFGALLLARWGYRPLLSDALRYQYEQTQQIADAHLLVRIAYAARRLSEVVSSPRATVCSEIAALLDIDAGKICELTGLVPVDVAEGGWGRPEGQPDTRVGASNAPLPGLVTQRALLGEMLTYWSGAETEQEVLRAIGQVLALFFGIHRVLYFWCDGILLRGTDLFEAESTISEAAIRLQPNASLIARAILDNQLLHTFGNGSSGLTVVDRAALGELACGGMLCLPLVDGGKPLGVFLAGLAPFRCGWLESHQGLLRGFTGRAAQALAAARRRQAQADWIQHETRSDCTLRARRAAHELRSPISVIRNYVGVMQMKLVQSLPVEADLQFITDELMRSDQIIEEFSQGFRKPAGVSKLALNAMIRDLAGLLDNTLIKDLRIKLTLSLDSRVPAELDLDPQALRQIILNLARNALEAMGEGGGLQLSTEDRVRFENGDYVAVTVADTGPGLPTEVLACLFEPVRSTKGEYHQGLGLNIVRHLADRMDARIICRSREDVGTTFTVLLPRRCSARQSLAAPQYGTSQE